jgi:dUTP pyrophosphatase
MIPSTTLHCVLEIPVVRLDVELPFPAAATVNDAGIDLHARAGAVLAPSGGRAVIGTGIAIELPPGVAGLVLPRSGLAARHGVTCLNAPGLVDPGYRGEVAVILVNTDPIESYEVNRADRIAQLVLVPLESTVLVVAGSLRPSERGEGGFGHTGR